MSRFVGERLVLVVDREGPAREIAAHFLREAGCRVEVAANGAAAWERTRELHPDLVMTEILVPKLDGLALCRRIKSEPSTSDIAVVIVSVLAAGARAREAGAAGFLGKPISEARIVGEVARLFPAPEMREQA